MARALGLIAIAWVTANSPWEAPAATRKPASRKPAAAPAPPPPQTVEALAELARPAVVVVTHYGRDGKEDGVGAGFVISSNGLVATSLHVIGEARPIAVRLANGQEHEVTAVHAWDRKLDLAILRIKAARLSALALGDSDSLKQGTPVVAMGNPLGLEHSIVQGVVSARREVEGLEMIQLAIPIEPGNSGGPLLDRQGRVQGILTMKSLLTANLGFAVPINALKPMLEHPNPVPIERWLTLGALNPRDWNPLFGARWSQRAGRIRVEGTGKSFGGRSLCLSHQPVPRRPYEVAVTVRLDQESGAAGLVFCSDGGDRHYGFYPTAGQLRLTRFEGPDVFSWNILKTAPSAEYRSNDWNTIRVRVETNRLLCYVNDRLAIESADHDLPDGKVGLAKFRDTRADFRHFRVGTNLAAPASGPPAALVEDLRRRIDTLPAAADVEALAALQPHAELSRSLLAERARKLEQEAAQLRRTAADLHFQSVRKTLVNLLAEPDDRIDLSLAALLVSKLDNPELEVEAYRQQLDAMAKEIAARLPAKADGTARLAALKTYLFEENGFHGSRNDYHNRANSYLNDVLDDREGLPISLSVLFLELARRIGLDHLAGVPLPAHFMVKYTPPGQPEQLFDVFDGARPLTRAEAAELVLAATGAPLADEHLEAASKRDIVLRMLRNLLNLSHGADSSTDALRYLDVILALEPEAALDRLRRGMIRARAGDAAGAKEDLQWLLDHDPPEIDAERLRELFRSL